MDRVTVVEGKLVVMAGVVNLEADDDVRIVDFEDVTLGVESHEEVGLKVRCSGVDCQGNNVVRVKVVGDELLGVKNGDVGLTVGDLDVNLAEMVVALNSVLLSLLHVLQQRRQ